MTAPRHPIPDAALESDIAILGKKGRGKSYTARGIAERLLARGRRVIVLDPLSTWWGLAAGEAGFPVAVLGGPHGDMPLAPEDGEALGRHLAGADQSAVLDLGAMRKGELIRFATAFLEELYTHNRDPLWLVLEEADVFAPQNPGADTARLYGEVDRIARRGRQFGFRLITLTQRPARLAKDVLTQLSTLVALGITSPQDREAIKAWVEGNADRDRARAVVDTLASLRVGEGWVWAPDLDLLERVTFPANRTPDTSATPQAGEARPATEIRARADVAAIRAALGSHDAGEDAGQAPSVRAGAKQAGADLTAAERRGFERGFAEGEMAERQRFRLAVARAIEDGAAAADTLAGRLRGVLTFIDSPGGRPGPGKPSTPAGLDTAAAPKPKPAPARASASAKQDAAGTLNSAARKMLAVLDTNPPVRRSWVQVATLAGLKARGGHFNAGKKALTEGGIVVADGDLIRIAGPSADAGPAVIDAAALVETWAGNLSGAAPRILRHLAGVVKSTRADIATDLGLTPRGGYWNAAWKELRDNALIVEAGEVVRLAEIFRGPT